MVNIQKLETQYLKAKVAYYEGTPLMTDTAFDYLEQELKQLNSKVIEQVGSKRKDFNFPHPTPMRSLSKIQTESKGNQTNYQEKLFIDWLNKKNSILLKFNKKINEIYYSPKFDGSAINIIYHGNNLESILTRGDGKLGKNITNKFYEYIPHTIKHGMISNNTITEIRCEVVISTKIFNEKYSSDFANARNFVAGIIGKDDIDKEKIKDLSIVPIHFIIDGAHYDIHEIEQSFINNKIFISSFLSQISINKECYIEVIKKMEKLRKTIDFQLDGVVFSVPPSIRKYLGENDHSPEWAIAIKFVPDEVITSVKGIEWSIGKSGELTPVVILNPVHLAGTIVKRASGYNAGYIVSNKIGIGSIISISKAGDIIPEIQNVITPGENTILPTHCLKCYFNLSFDGIHLKCNNENCKGIISKKLMIGADILDLKNVGEKTLEPFAKHFKNIYELFCWVKTSARYGNIDKYGIKYGSKSHYIFINAFENIKSISYEQVILMMGYDGVGKKLAKQIAREYCGLTPDYANMEKRLVEKFKDPNIVSYIKTAVMNLSALGVHVDRPIDDNVEKYIYVCMTGSPKTFGYKTKEEFIKQFSNVIETSLSDPHCSFLITDSYQSTSGKMKDANKKGIKIVTYNDFKI